MNKKPDTAQQWFRVSPLAVIFFALGIAQKLLSQGLPAVLVLVALIASSEADKTYWIFRVAIVLVVLGIGFSIFSYLRFRYRVTDDRVLMRQGVFKREELDIEFQRVQNITIQEPFYMRPLGLSVLNIDTAGSGEKEISIAGIQRDLALSLRDRILGSEKSASPEPADQQLDNVKAKLLVALNRRDVLIYGLTANFSWWIVIAIGAVFGSDEITTWFIGWLEARFSVTETVLYLQNEGGTLLLGLVIFGLILLGLIMFPLISILGAVFRYDGYRLSVDGETYRKSSGFLTRFDDSLKQHKIQALIWKQNAIALYFKRISIQLRQASAGRAVDSGQLPSGLKTTFLVPALQPELANELSGEFFPDCKPAQAVYSPVDRRRFMVFNMAATLLPISLVTLIPALLVSWKFLLVIPVLTGIIFLITNRCWQKAGYAVDGGYGFVRSGFIGTQTTIFPLFKIQRIDVRQTPIQHRKGLAHLTIHLASHSVKVPYISVDDANRFRDLTVYCAESSQAAWY